MELEDFRKILNKKKPYRDLPDEYKTDKFLLLYLKIYEYMLSIPKEEIVYKCIKDSMYSFLLEFIHIISCFVKSRDFNNWRYRIYTLITKRIHNSSFKKYELWYNSKAKEIWNEYRINLKKSVENAVYDKYGVVNVFQLEEVKEKSKKKNLERRGVEYVFQSKEVQDKFKKNYLEKHGCENPFQDPKVKQKIERSMLERHGVKHALQSKEILDKAKATTTERYGVDSYAKTDEWKSWFRNYRLSGNYIVNYKFVSHSKMADEFCINLYTKLPDDLKPYAIFYKKDNKEYELRDKGKLCKYDFTISSESVKVIVEFDGLYWHGLKEGQKDVRGTPVEEVWEEDMRKQRLAEDRGFRVIRVREDEYLEDKEGCIERVLKRIMEEISDD